MNTKACNKPFFTHESELENRIQCVVLRRGLIAQALVVLLIFVSSVPSSKAVGVTLW